MESNKPTAVTFFATPVCFQVTFDTKKPTIVGNKATSDVKKTARDTKILAQVDFKATCVLFGPSRLGPIGHNCPFVPSVACFAIFGS